MRDQVEEARGNDMYQDKSITCRDCGEDFVFTAGAQEFSAQEGFDDVMVPGTPAEVPFQPMQGRPVYCRDCFNRRRSL